MENKIKYLEMIENVIERMARNSFELKGWAVTLIALVGALASQGSDKRFVVLAFIPAVTFWFLDSFYLQMERKYKILYKNVAVKSDNDKIDFDMDTRKIVLSVEESKRVCFCKCLFSRTELWFYFPIIIAIIAVIILLKVF